MAAAWRRVCLCTCRPRETRVAAHALATKVVHSDDLCGAAVQAWFSGARVQVLLACVSTKTSLAAADGARAIVRHSPPLRHSDSHGSGGGGGGGGAFQTQCMSRHPAWQPRRSSSLSDGATGHRRRREAAPHSYPRHESIQWSLSCPERPGTFWMHTAKPICPT